MKLSRAMFMMDCMNEASRLHPNRKMMSVRSGCFA